ncbi:MAG: flagellar basal body P-ring formation protein FlgA [Planctomyces sp.]|nr:flagellar basal body P-ring formation protein FlgA [Planctomyces sp.]
MTGRTGFVRVAAVAVLALLAACVGPSRAAWAGSIEIALRNQADVATAIVRIGDVAEVHSDDRAAAERLRQLDLTELREPGDEDTITLAHVRARMLLDGIATSSVRMTGARQTTVRRVRATPAPTTDASGHAQVSGQSPLLDLLREEITARLSAQWLANFDDVEVRFVGVEGRVARNIPDDAIPELELPQRVDPGRLALRVRWLVNEQLLRTEPVSVEVRLRQPVVLATAAIPRGQVVQASHLIVEERLLGSRVEPVSPEEFVGRSARRTISPGDVVGSRDLGIAKQNQPDVKSRDVVRVVARKGGVTVVLQAAEALQAGRIGETIRVRNLQSNRVLMGQIVSAREVEVVLDRTAGGPGG